jgi:Mrp family chromosome partitioning ATPase/DUF971 family protein
MVTETAVLDALRAIVDPDLHRDIVSLGFVKKVKINGGAVSFIIELTTPACPVREQFRAQAEAVVRALPGVTAVDIEMTAQQRHAPAPSVSLDNIGTVIAVSSCKGGVGKSTVAALLARALQREGLAVGLLDADIHGPSIPTLFNTHHPNVACVGETFLPVVVDGLATMSLGYFMGEKPAVMRGPMVSNYVMQLLSNTDWGTLDYLLIDLPPGTGDIQLTLTQRVSFDGAIIVTTPQALSLVDVARGILMFERLEVPVLGVVENMAFFACDGCGKKHHPFGDSSGTLHDRFGLETLARLPILPNVHSAAARDAGADIPEFAELAERLHRAVGMRRGDHSGHPEISADAAFISVRWPDGSESRVANRTLRLSCRCALCIDEMSGAPMLDPAGVPADIQPVEIVPLGNYAVGISWNDGHSSGIYSWEHIRRVAGESSAAQCGCGSVHKG